MTLVLAHLSDLHLPPEAGPTLRQLLGKRLLSYLAWQRKRRRRLEVPLPDLLADLAAFPPDVIAVTGDLTHFALPAEFAAGRAFLQSLGPPGKVLAIPGNHDALVPVPWPQGQSLWAEWMRGDAEAPGEFPYLRRVGDVALIGLSTALPTLPGLASGRLGAEQIGKLAVMLAQAGRQGLCRVVLIHHPPTGENRRRGLDDRVALLEVLRQHGAEMLLHGHSHRPALEPLLGQAGQALPGIGVPQALAGAGHRHLARWHLYRIARGSGGWELHTSVRGHDPSTGGFQTVGEWKLMLSSAA